MAARTGNRWIRALVFVLALILAGLIWINRDQFSPVEVGARAPDYEVYSLRGDTLNIRDYRGSVLVLNVWATWCTPCVREMPSLERLHQLVGREGLEIIAVSVDNTPNADEAVRAFGERFNLTFPLVRDPSGDIQTAYAVGGLPTTFIIDRDGRIQQRLLGAREWDSPEMVASLRRIMER
jgi:peroxiredoxin